MSLMDCAKSRGFTYFKSSDDVVNLVHKCTSDEGKHDIIVHQFVPKIKKKTFPS